MNKVIVGDCTEELKKLEDNSVDLIVTDPPYGYSFMGKDWDKAVPSIEIWKECLRALKPGAFAFVMSAPRQDVLSQMIVRIGEGGFDTSFTSIYWTYASGFPKAMNIGKMVDKRLGVQGEIVEEREHTFNEKNHSMVSSENGQGGTRRGKLKDDKFYVRALASEEAKALEGSYGNFSPKPAVEVVIVAQKPRNEKTSVDQALAWLNERDEVLRGIADAVKAQYNQDVIWDEEAQYHPKSA